MRIFVALNIDDEIRERIVGFQAEIMGFVPEARWVRSESLHITLKFVGEKPEGVVENIRATLTAVSMVPLEVTFRGYGFFPSDKAARVFWIGVEGGPQLAALAGSIEEKLSVFGVSPEDHIFSPHLTLARRAAGAGGPRHKSDRPNRLFQPLQEKLAAMLTPQFGTRTAREFFLYESRISREGPRYIEIARFSAA